MDPQQVKEEVKAPDTPTSDQSPRGASKRGGKNQRTRRRASRPVPTVNNMASVSIASCRLRQVVHCLQSVIRSSWIFFIFHMESGKHRLRLQYYKGLHFIRIALYFFQPTMQAMTYQPTGFTGPAPNQWNTGFGQQQPPQQQQSFFNQQPLPPGIPLCTL